MVNIKRIGSGILGAGAVLFVAATADAGLPTFDAANISGTVSIVKNGSENLKGISDITNKVGELNTIVGDAAASISKFKEHYGEKISKGIEIAKKVMARKEEAKAAKAAHDAEVQAQKDAYQAAMDNVEDGQQNQPETQEEYNEETENGLDEMPTAAMASVKGVTEDTYENNVEIGDAFSAMSSADRVYEDEYEDEDAAGGENLDGVPGDDVSGVEISEMSPREQWQIRNVPAEQMNAEVVGKAGLMSEENENSPSLRRAFVRPEALNGNNRAGMVRIEPKVDAVVKPEAEKLSVGGVSAAPAVVRTETPTKRVEPIQRQRFRVSPSVNRVEKVSRSTYSQHEDMAFASSVGDGEDVGNSYVGNVYIVPMAQRCEISAQSFINDEKTRNECIEKIIRENNADNSFDSNLSMKDCRKMVYNAVVALLAEATNAKYEAANYGDTLDEQDKLAADSTDVRGDLTVIAMSNYQTQLLLNRISMNFASQIILETVEQICAAHKDVLGDSDLDQKSDAGGEK